MDNKDCTKSVIIEVLMKKANLIITKNLDKNINGICCICQGDILSSENSICSCGAYPAKLVCCKNFVHVSCITHKILKECPLCRKSFKL